MKTLIVATLLLTGCASGPDAPIRQITTPQGMTDQEYTRYMDQQFMREQNRLPTVISQQQQRRSTWVDMQPVHGAMQNGYKGD